MTSSSSSIQHFTLESLVEYLAEAVIGMDLNMCITSWNRGAERLYGYSKPEALGQPVSWLYPPGYIKKKAILKKLGRGANVKNLETIRQCKNGSLAYISMTISPIWDEFHHMVGMAAIARDITEQRQAEEALRLSEVHLRAIVDNAVEGIIATDHTGNIISFNPAASRIFGYDSGEMVGQNVRVLMPEPYHSEHEGYLENYKRTGVGKIIGSGREVTGKRKNGDVFPIDISISEARDGQEPIFVGLIRDITERKQFEAENMRLAALVESSNDAIVGLNLSGQIVSWNPAAEKIYGYTPKEALEQPISILFPAHQTDEVPQLLTHIRQGRRVEHIEKVRRRKDGQLIHVSLSLSPIMDKDDHIIGTSAISRDVTDRKRGEEQLKASLKEKEVMLQEIHHRVKNNLQIISSLANLQSKVVRDEQLTQILQGNYNRIKSMAMIHEKLYQSSNLSDLDFKDYAQSLARYLFRMYQIDPTHISLVLDIEPISMNIDRAIPCGLIINELISNALKYAFSDGRKGTVALTFHSISHTSKAILTVSDDGVGIAKKQLNRPRQSLGLQLVQTLAAQLKGQLEVTNQGGTRFQIQFDLKQGY